MTTEAEYSALMKKALTNELHWHGMTATPIEAREVRDWLEETLIRLKRDFELRKAEMQLATARHPKSTRTYWQEVEKYEEWRIRAMRFRHLCEDRLRELKKTHLLRGGGPAKPTAVQKAQAHSEYMNRQLSHVTNSLIELSAAVESFERGETTTRDLASRLDQLTVPHSGVSTRTLRQLLVAKAAKAGAE